MNSHKIGFYLVITTIILTIGYIVYLHIELNKLQNIIEIISN